MGYFDSLVDSSFKTDSKGRTVFFLRGIFGKGCILPTEQKKNDLRNFLKKFYIVSLSAIIGTGITVGWLWFVILVPILLFWSYFGVRKHTKGLERTTERLTWKESCRNSASTQSVKTLWFSFIGSALFVVASIFLLVINSISLIWGILGVLFFGACAIGEYKMLKAKNS